MPRGHNDSLTEDECGLGEEGERWSQSLSDSSTEVFSRPRSFLCCMQVDGGRSAPSRGWFSSQWCKEARTNAKEGKKTARDQCTARLFFFFFLFRYPNWWCCPSIHWDKRLDLLLEKMCACAAFMSATPLPCSLRSQLIHRLNRENTNTSSCTCSKAIGAKQEIPPTRQGCSPTKKIEEV